MAATHTANISRPETQPRSAARRRVMHNGITDLLDNVDGLNHPQN